MKRNFVGQRNCTSEPPKETVLSANSIEEMIEQIWEEARKQVSREVVIHPDKSCSIKNENPTIADIDKFVSINDQIARKVYEPTKLKYETVRGFNKKHIRILIYTYSTNIENSKVWNSVREKIQQLEKKDRSSTQALIQMTDRINKLSAKCIPNMNLITEHLQNPKLLVQKIDNSNKVDLGAQVPKNGQEECGKDTDIVTLDVPIDDGLKFENMMDLGQEEINL